MTRHLLTRTKSYTDTSGRIDVVSVRGKLLSEVPDFEQSRGRHMLQEDHHSGQFHRVGELE